MTVLAATAWPSNGHLIADVFELYRYLIGPDPLVLDPTYGKGNWWTQHRPERLVGYNREAGAVSGMLAEVSADPRSGFPDYRWDFREMPTRWTGLFDVVAYDPPYVCAGGRKTTTIPGMHQAYGMDDAPTTPLKLQQLINEGLHECNRVTKPGGLIIVKCQDYISSGKLWIGTHHTLSCAINALDLELLDRLEHYGSVRPQPKETNGKARRVMHARRNLSTLFVFRKGK